ncbi:YmaF family protein [Clostridium sp.]|uniref:YmaF family protein n=1 Tax=Clostridium sp. TaxID=1506 RepID=UPI0025C1CB5D|nr:YmaF family protein [Clostridium sp.]
MKLHTINYIKIELYYWDIWELHKIKTSTDFLGYFHEICIITDPAIPVINCNHVYLAKATPTFVDCHIHKFIFTKLVEVPVL